MALRTAIGACARIPQEMRTCSSLVARRGVSRQSCAGGAPPPPCPACRPPARPPCRAAPPARVRATRRVCCPPPAGSPPPCDPPPCSPPLNCQLARTKKQAVPKAKCYTRETCEVQMDRVACRLAIAKQQRRLDYEQEVAARPTCFGPTPPPVAYSLGNERECAQATDGKNYLIPCDRTPPQPCGPDRTPPPPRCVELAIDNDCQIRNNAYIDPCTHHPRTLIDIDRSGDKAATVNSVCAPPDRPSSGKKFTTRLMESLKLSRNSGVTCPRRPCDSQCSGKGARRAGDSSWCSQPAPGPVAPRCREPTAAEKLKRRGPGRCGGGADGARRFHTSAVKKSTKCATKGDKKADERASPAKAKADAEKLKKVLQERESLQEAARGRVVTGLDSSKKAKSSPAGRLDIPVPPGAENVSVQITLGGANPCQKKCQPACPPSDGNVRFSSDTKLNEKPESWLSMKSIQKKLASCGRKVESKAPFCPGQTPKPTKKENPCAPPPKPKSPCGPPKPKPTCPPLKTPTCPLPKAPSCPSPAKPAKEKCPPSPCAPKKSRFSLPSKLDTYFFDTVNFK